MTNRSSVPITGCLLAVAVLMSLPHTALADVPGFRVPQIEANANPVDAPAAPEIEALSAREQESRCLEQRGDNSDPRVVPPCATPFGSTYAEWSLAWWKWFLPQTAFPDGIQADCSSHQTGPVWFLVGGPTHIDCTAPYGKALFFPIVDVECSNREVNTPFYGKTPGERRKCAEDIIDAVALTSLKAEIDGIAIRNLKNYRFATPDFSFTVPDGNIGGIPTDVSHSGKSSADGYYLMLAPLPPGRHTIHFTGTFRDFGTLDTTYTLTVRAGRRD